MNRISLFSRGNQPRLFILFAVALLTASIVSGRNALQSETRQDRDRVEAEVITILQTGFQPSTITRPHGQFLILIDNRSELEDLTLRLDSVAGKRLRELRQTKKQNVVKQLEDLPPGEYLLTAEEQPEWICRITITH